MSEGMKEAAELAAKAKRLESLILRWSDEADRLMIVDDQAIPESTRKLLREIAEASV